MAAVKRGRRNPNQVEIVKEKEGEKGFVDEKPTSTGVSEVASSSSSESNVARLRERWELASVLNFLHVFKPLIELKMELSAEEIEQGLITPNNVLSQLHIALLKGIPPVNKNLSGPDAWMAILLKKLAPWWPWVAEGEIPLAAGQGEEVSRYKELDPLTRLLVLKALCEIRAFQDDIVTHINDALKEGALISNFRKDRMGGGRNGTSYWYDADENIGHRLYREVAKVDCTPKSKGKGRLSQPRISYEWETIATNLEEFQQISVKLSSSKAGEESAVSQMIVDDIIPEIEKIQKKKEQAFKRQQRQEILLSGVFKSFQTEGIRSCRSRKPVNYTFDEYDRSINEGLQLLTKKRKTNRERSQEKKEVANGRMNGGAAKDSSQNSDDNEKDDGSSGSDDAMDTDVDHDNLKGTAGGSDSDDADFDDKNDENDSKSDDDDDDDDAASEESASSGSENKTRGSRTRFSQKHKGRFVKNGAGLRRSTRLTGNASDSDTDGKHHADTKKMLRQRPTRNSDYRPGSASDSEDTKSSEKTSSEASGSENESKDVLKGLLEENEENTESEKENTENEEENAEDEEESTENKKENAESEEEGAENEKENAESEEEESTENKKEAESEEEGTENEKENAESEEAGTENEKDNTDSDA